VVKIAEKTLTFAHSPDPDDAFMFYGFAAGAVTVPGFRIEPHHEDIESLNARALKGEFEITAVSAHAYAHVSHIYWGLSCGASVGRGYGPILIQRKESTPRRSPWKVAIPGPRTTAALVFNLWLAEHPELTPEKVVLSFEEILPAVQRGDIDAGLIIHEGQLTYAEQGLEKIWDAGAWWQEKTGLPLPLGLAVVRSDLGMGLAKEIDAAFRQSILYAQAHAQEATEYALQFGRGLNTALGKRFIGMYVNEDTLQQGKEVQQGLEQLYSRAFAAGLLPHKPKLTFI
jgi:1,4-dihydroxy-6-naphthoate synthase